MSILQNLKNYFSDKPLKEQINEEDAAHKQNCSDDLHKLRLEIDSVIQFMNKYWKDGAWILESVRALILAKMWAGKLLSEFGNKDPYPNSKDFNNPQIEPSQDVAEEALDLDEGTLVQTIKALRAFMDDLLDQCDEIENVINLVGDDVEMGIYDLIVQYITEAQMWLGRELAAIRDNQAIEGGKK